MGGSHRCGHRAGVGTPSFVAEVKSDLMGEQTYLCGIFTSRSLLCYDKMVAEGVEPGYTGFLSSLVWETITEVLEARWYYL